jgi:glycosyltransferase involved in cell wall biosynthesis
LIGRELDHSKPFHHPDFKSVRLRCRFNSGPLFYLEYNWKLYRYLKKQVITSDIVNSIDADTLTAGYYAKKSTGCTLVFDAHEYFSQVPELKEGSFKQKIWKSVEDRFIPFADKCYTVGPALAKLFSGLYSTSFAVVRNCPPKRDWPPVQPAEPPYLLYQGALNKGRGIESAILAMNYLPDMKLVLIGDGDIRNELEALVQDNELSDRVEFLGFIQPDDLHKYTRFAFAGLNVSEPLGESYFYSLNNKCFDYLHAGLPAITNPFPEYRKINEQYETMVFANANDLEIANAVRKLRENDTWYRKLKDNCLIAALRFNWEREEQELLRVYAEIEND